MPKESKNYPEITQKLLRRARQGHIFHNPTPVTNGKDDKTKGATKEATKIVITTTVIPPRATEIALTTAMRLVAVSPAQGETGLALFSATMMHS